MADNSDSIYEKKVLRQILWWMFVLMWFCFCKSYSRSRNNRTEGVNQENAWQTRILATEEGNKAREDFIVKTLVTKKFVIATKDQNASSVSQKQGSFINAVTAFFDQSDSSNEIDEMNTCAICLGEYEEGENICRSINSYCKHAFHKDCIVEWLMKHNECPCCRKDYLSTNDEENNHNIDSNTNTPEISGSSGEEFQEEEDVGAGDELSIAIQRSIVDATRNDIELGQTSNEIVREHAST